MFSIENAGKVQALKNAQLHDRNDENMNNHYPQVQSATGKYPGTHAVPDSVPLKANSAPNYGDPAFSSYNSDKNFEPVQSTPTRDQRPSYTNRTGSLGNHLHAEHGPGSTCATDDISSVDPGMKTKLDELMARMNASMNLLKEDKNILQKSLEEREREIAEYKTLLCERDKELDSLKQQITENEQTALESKNKAVREMELAYMEKNVLVQSKLDMAEMNLKQSQENNIKLETELNEARSEIRTKNEKISKSNARMKILDYIEGVTLFDCKVGNIILKSYNSQRPKIDSFFTEEYPKVHRFFTDADQIAIYDFTAKLESFHRLNENIQRTITERFDSLSEHFDKNVTVPPEDLHKMNEEIIDKIDDKLRKYENLFDTETGLQREISDLKIANHDLTHQLNRVVGDAANKIRYASLKHVHMTKEKYDELAIDSVEQYTLTELQNIVKRASLELEVPPSTLLVNLPRLNVAIEQQVILMKFAYWTLQVFANQELDVLSFTERAVEVYETTGCMTDALRPLEQTMQGLRTLLALSLEDNGECDSE
ncbi:Cnm67p KNAG_0F00870 [Huiozyma naganishii CBS 8797]|uniref:Uncharacterized protein n=1 Tax=Huiozyma naganishii (strain ATCC MYA-139 / BCRC 22969 / CBS 8797 / KCTC 17520 / NBRC 10181 / NCYC 3082 / Yp74L-3) TaxID=1071383 RepID=J7S882_HUIN7|nr:hypothetical protein KNAG_0F00870 [Kazachstania naganishii CBS 8797]CCK70756.1 hypothetical protein KNAG_0F00870 [Kazachstania naganishii CBS 8797]